MNLPLPTVNLTISRDITPEQEQFVKAHFSFVESMLDLERRERRTFAWALALFGTLLALVALDLLYPGPNHFVGLLLSVCGIVAIAPGLLLGSPNSFPPPSAPTPKRYTRHSWAMWIGLWILVGVQTLAAIWRLTEISLPSCK